MNKDEKIPKKVTVDTLAEAAIIDKKHTGLTSPDHVEISYGGPCDACDTFFSAPVIDGKKTCPVCKFKF